MSVRFRLVGLGIVFRHTSRRRTRVSGLGKARIPDARTHRRRRRGPSTQRAQLFFRNPKFGFYFPPAGNISEIVGLEDIGAWERNHRQPGRPGQFAAQRCRSARVSGSIGTCAAPHLERNRRSRLPRLLLLRSASLYRCRFRRRSLSVDGHKAWESRAAVQQAIEKIVAKNAMKNGNRCRTKVTSSTCI
jgi:hypothetical protein